MIEIVDCGISVDITRIGFVMVKYNDLIISCDICVYKQQKIWIRLPEMWISETQKRRFLYWPSEEKSNDFQKEVLSKLEDLLGLNLPVAKRILSDWHRKRYGKKIQGFKNQNPEGLPQGPDS